MTMNGLDAKNNIFFALDFNWSDLLIKIELPQFHRLSLQSSERQE
jgi:hypothetical protein